MKTGKPSIESLASENEELKLKLKELQNELRRVNQQLEEVQKIEEIGNWEIDLKTGITQWSPATYHLFGYDENEVSPEEVLDKQLHPEDKKLFWITLQKSKGDETLSLPEMIFRAYNKKKELLHINSRGFYKHDEDNKKTTIFGVFHNITKLKLDEERFSRKEQRLENVIQASPVGIAVFSSDNKISQLNDKFVKLFGYTLDDIAKVDDWFPKAYPDKNYRDKVMALWLSAIDNYFENGVFEPIEASVTCKDGSKKDIEFSFQTIGDIYLTTFVDITLRKRAEKALIASEQKYRHLFEDSRDPILLIDGQKFIDCNQAAADLLNMSSKDEIVGKKPEEISPEYQPDGTRSDEKARFLIAEVIRKGYLRFEWLHLSADNRAVYMEVSITSVKGQGSIFLYTIWRDITKQKEQANALKLSKEEAEAERNKFKNFIETLPVGVSLINPKGRILEVNSKSEEILGLKKDLHKKSSIKSRNWKIVREDGSPMPSEEFPASRALLGEELVQDVVMGIINEEDKLTWMSVSAASIDEKAGGGAAVVYEDITAKKIAEQELRESEERYKSLIAALSEGIVMQSRTGKIIAVNASAQRLLGITDDDIIGKEPINSSWKTIHEDGSDYPNEEHPAMKALVTGKPIDNEIMGIYKPNGSLIWLQVHSEPIMKPGENEAYAVVTSFTDISEQRSVQRTIKESEERFKKLSNLTFEGILIHDNGICIDANISFCKLFGYELDDLIGENILEIIFPVEFQSRIKKELKKKHSKAIELKAVKKNGKRFPIELEVQNIMWGNEKVQVSAIRDISEKAKAKKALKESERRFKTLTELSKEGIVIQHKGKIVDINLSYQKMMGMSYSELIDKPVISLAADEESRQVVKQKMKDGFLGSYEISIKRKDKSSFPAEVFTQETIIKGKKMRVASIRDLTYYKITDDEIRKLSTAVKQSPISIFVTDIEGKIEYVNPAFTTISGYAPEEVIGKDTSLFKSGNTPRETYDELWATVSSGKVWQGEFLNKKKDGSLYWEKAIITPVTNDTNKITSYLAIKEDITEKKKSEERLQDMLAELERSNRDLDQFASVSSHDLQEPLRKIKNYTELLASKFTNLFDDQGHEYIDIITRGTTRMQQLIDDLLSYSRVSSQAEQFKKVNINDILNDVEDNLELAIFKAKAKVKKGDLPIITGDGSQLYLLFQNLVSNALKFRSDRPPLISIDTKEERSTILFSIKDNGIGIHKKYASKIFTIFQRLHSRDEYEGTGIGLAICKKIVERHNGKIWFESKLGEGTTFFVELPKKD